MWHMTHSCVCHVTRSYVWHHFIYIWHVTRSYVWHDSIHMWLVHTCDMIQFTCDSFIRVTWFNSHVTRSYVWHDSIHTWNVTHTCDMIQFTREMWLVHTCEMIQFTLDTWLVHIRVTWFNLYVTCDVTRSYLWRDIHDPYHDRTYLHMPCGSVIWRMQISDIRLSHKTFANK